MATASRWALGLLLLAAAACQSPPAAGPPQAATDPAALAAEALSRGEYQQAAELYRRALEQSPDSVPLHYGLAVAASYLGRRGDTVREFQWVMARGVAGSPEVDAARRWLTQAGVLPRPSRLPDSAEPERAPDHASLEGRAVFAEAGKPPQPMRRLPLFLVGQPNSPTKEERYNLRTDEDGRFKFPSVVPGPYKLTNRVAGQPVWRLRVELRPAEGKVLDLTAANSVAARDDFPDPR